MGTPITIENIEQVLKDRVAELLEEPEYKTDFNSDVYALDADGNPIVKVAAANVSLEYDLWEGMRNPASIGCYPAGMPEFWEYYAHRRKRNIDETGRYSIFQIPRSYESASKEYNRAVIISVMLPFSHNLIKTYARPILKRGEAKPYAFKKTYDKVNRIINKAVTRAAVDLMNAENVVIPLDDDTVKSISREIIPASRQGASHGPCKDVNVPQKSIAVLVGLGQLGISRMLFCDEMSGGEIVRYTGPLRSIVIFDKDRLETDGRGGVIYPTQAWREFLFRLTDFTDIDPEIDRFRFCSYLGENGNGCSQCVQYCPSGAQPSSAPGKNGKYPEEVAKQSYRFFNDKLQFDFARCLEDRGQMASMIPEWACARCITICAASGIRKEFPAANYRRKTAELASAQ
ncbi:MAG: hypothetical protein JW852_03430 [Spirochaetales bacterium]|nr:hypothetical protein [Spirochaetales bacterium]